MSSLGQLGSLVISLEANIAQFEKDLSKAEAQMQKFGANANTVIGAVKTVIGGLATFQSVNVFAGFIQGGIDLGDQLNKLSQKTGTSVESLAGLKFAADQSDVSLEAVAKAAQKLGSSMSANPAVFKQFGITAKDTTGALVQFADIIAGMPDGVDKTALAVKVLGKSGADLIPFLNQGSAGIQEMVDKGKLLYPVTAEMAKQAEEYNDKMDQLKANADRLAISMANTLLPSLTDTATEMNKLVDSGNGFLAVLRGIAGIGKLPWDVIIPPSDLKKQLSPEGMIKDLEIQISQLERNKQSGNGKLFQMIFGTPAEIDAEIKMLRDRVETIKKHADELRAQGKTVEPPKPKTPVGPNLYDALSPQRGNTLVDNLQTNYDKENEAQKRAIAAPTMSATDKTLADNMAKAQLAAAGARQEISKLMIEEGKREKLLQAVDAAEKKQLANLKSLNDQLKASNASWEHGAKVSMRVYLDEAENISKQSEQMFTKMFKGMEDALVSFVQSGKMDFKSLADSIIADLIRIQVRKAIAGVMGSVFGGTGGAKAGTAVPSKAGGGYTGDAPRSGGIDGIGGFMAILHPQETVTDHTTQAGASSGAVNLTSAPVINIDSRTDKAEIDKMVRNAVQQGNNQLVDRLQRRRML